MKSDCDPEKAEANNEDELRPEYTQSDFTEPFVRGKYAERARESSNVVVLRPEVAKAFPNEGAVNDALMSLIEIAKRTARPVE
jgi:hypothetical protein